MCLERGQKSISKFSGVCAEYYHDETSPVGLTWIDFIVVCCSLAGVTTGTDYRVPVVLYCTTEYDNVSTAMGLVKF